MLSLVPHLLKMKTRSRGKVLEMDLMDWFKKKSYCSKSCTRSSLRSWSQGLSG